MENIVNELIARIESMETEDKIKAINSIKLALHDVSPFNSEPVDCVLWVKSDEVVSNNYNPNQVAPPEMELLMHSVMSDGYTQPIVCHHNGDSREVVDGFHRSRVGKEVEEVRARLNGYLPVTMINSERAGENDRMASTIRHNRARGEHLVCKMSDIIIDLSRRNWSDTKIAKELGMEPDEVLRLKQVSGIETLFEDSDFSEAWEHEQ